MYQYECVMSCAPYPTCKRVLRIRIIVYGCMNLMGPASDVLHLTCATIALMQGREKDVIIFCSVRSRGDLGFLSDPRRLNVAMTRAKRALVLVGHGPTLMQHGFWSKWVTAADPFSL
jgi:hypothetical protein